MLEIKRLRKKTEILNSEGMILGLFVDQSGALYLGSYLTDKSGTVYYSTDKKNLKKYFNSEISLRQVYLDSESFIVSREFRKERECFLKMDFVDKIQCGDQLYNTISELMKDKSAESIYGS